MHHTFTYTYQRLTPRFKIITTWDLGVVEQLVQENIAYLTFFYHKLVLSDEINIRQFLGHYHLQKYAQTPGQITQDKQPKGRGDEPGSTSVHIPTHYPKSPALYSYSQ